MYLMLVAKKFKAFLIMYNIKLVTNKYAYNLCCSNKNTNMQCTIIIKKNGGQEIILIEIYMEKVPFLIMNKNLLELMQYFIGSSK